MCICFTEGSGGGWGQICENVSVMSLQGWCGNKLLCVKATAFVTLVPNLNLLLKNATGCKDALIHAATWHQWLFKRALGRAIFLVFQYPELKKTKHLAVEQVYLNCHSAKCHYSAVQPSKSEPHSPKSSPRPHSEAAECRQPSAP